MHIVPCEDRLRLAAKARCTRMMKPHPKRKDLEVSEEIRNHWHSGNKDQMVDELIAANFERVCGLH